ncbi:MAG: FAD binding domain-containing protein [Planctomycetota bacterium]|nr:FAD binding domain-containing protein [Planctomycetota bacterium]
MLRLPSFQVANPRSVSEAVALLAEHGDKAMLLAGGTDLVPNMKHELFTPDIVVSLGQIEELRGVRTEDDGTLVIGATTTIDAVAHDATVRAHAPALSQATSLIAGPQLRRMGTLGGNVMLDTRCQWYNQTHFWRSALGYCLKKDGTVCHVIAGAQKCVAAASNDSAPVLMTLGASIVFQGPAGRREIPIDDLWHSDGIWNKKAAKDELLTEVRIPPQAPGHRGAYGKLRDRNSIDFPLLGLAVRLDLGADGTVEDADVCAVALAARPTRIKRMAELLSGTKPGQVSFDDAVERCAAQAYRQCRPLPNVPGDHEYRREMVPVYLRRTLRAAADGTGPVHCI